MGIHTEFECRYGSSQGGDLQSMQGAVVFNGSEKEDLPRLLLMRQGEEDPLSYVRQECDGTGRSARLLAKAHASRGDDHRPVSCTNYGLSLICLETIPSVSRRRDQIIQTSVYFLLQTAQWVPGAHAVK